jgi:hypothetical protein
MKRPLRLTLISASAFAVFAVLAPFASAGAGTLYASPTGTGVDPCPQAAPCSLAVATEEAVNEDTVIVEPGTYTLTASLGIASSIELGGQPGVPVPVLKTTNLDDVYVGSGAKPHIHDLRIEGTGGLVGEAATVERVFVSDSGSGEACSISVGGSLLDSVCWGSGSGNGSALAPSSHGEDGTVVLRNVTAIAANAGGDAIHARTNDSGDKLLVEGTNVIASAANHPDVEDDLGGGGLPVIEVKLANSNYATVAGELPPFATITAPGTNGNQTAAPAFVNAAAGDFREAAGSATIDAGLNDPLNGPLDLAADSRSLPACLGGVPVTDIGAYEFVPTASCATPKPKPSLSPFFGKIGVERLKLDKKKGTATLLVNVSGPGQLTISGKGAKKASRFSHGAGVVKLPIKPVGKAKKSLARAGKVRLRLKLQFVPNGGSAEQLTKKLKLIKKVG